MTNIHWKSFLRMPHSNVTNEAVDLQNSFPWDRAWRRRFSDLFNIHSRAINCASALSDGPAQQLLSSGHKQESYRVHLPTNKVISRKYVWLHTVLELTRKGKDSFLLALNEFCQFYLNDGVHNAAKRYHRRQGREKRQKMRRGGSRMRVREGHGGA